MSDNSVIPGSAVEAAARMMLARQEFGGMMGGWDGLDDDERDSLLEDAKDVLEAAAPHMLAGALGEGDEAWGSNHVAIGANPFKREA